jgi:hypothetical protein
MRGLALIQIHALPIHAFPILCSQDGPAWIWQLIHIEMGTP